MVKQISRGLFQIILIANGEKKFLTRVNQDILFNYIQSVLFRKHCTPITINGAGNHLHILTDVSPDISISQIVKEIQINTTDFLRREKSVFPEFTGWSLNYVALSFGQNQQNELIEFVNGQFNYHRIHSLSEELQYLIGEPENANA